MDSKQANLNPLSFYTLDEVAERFRVSRRTMQDFIRAHPFYRQIGRRKLFTEDDIHSLAGAMESPVVKGF